MTTYYVSVRVYDATDSSRYFSDKITVSRTIWESLDARHTDASKPIFVEVQVEDTIFAGRIVPAIPADELGPEQCIIPEWLWLALGAPYCDEVWIQMRPCALPMLAAMTLRPRTVESLASLADPVGTLSEQIAQAWSCVTQDAELALECGTFDIMALVGADGCPLRAGCILNTDVRLELEPALDTPATVVAATEPILPTTDARFLGTGYRLGRK